MAANPQLGTELVITGCSQEIRIPLPAELPAPPTITSFVGSHVEWTLAQPTDLVTVGYGTIYSGAECGVAPTTSSFDIGPSDGTVYVSAWAADVATSTSLGEAHVRGGAFSVGSTN